MICRTIVSLTLFFIFASSLHAAVMERDWKMLGDGLLTFDDVNNREWLDLSQSIRVQFGGTTGEENFQNTIAQLEPGGLFEEFTWAGPDDVRGFAQSAGIVTTTLDFDTNVEPVTELINLIGSTVPSTPIFSVGFVNDRQTAVFQYFQSQDPIAGLLLGPGSGALGRPATSGLMLYRNAVPEPSTAAYFAAVLSGTVAASRSTLRVGGLA